VCVCTVTDVSGEVKLAASNFARWFMGVLDWESPILGWGLLPQKPKIGQIGYPPGSNFQGAKSYHNCVPIKFVQRVDVGSASVDIRPSPEDGRTCLTRILQ